MIYVIGRRDNGLSIGRHHTMGGKFCFGEKVQDLIRAFDFSPAAQPDVALQNNADILIADIEERKIAPRFPHGRQTASGN